MQRELRAAKDVASCSAAQAAGAEASQQDLQHLQVCLPQLTPCLIAHLPDTCRYASGLAPCLVSYLPNSCRYASCLTPCLFSHFHQLQVAFLSYILSQSVPPMAACMLHVTIQGYTDLSSGP